MGVSLTTCFLYFCSFYSKSTGQLTPTLSEHVHGRGTVCLPQKRATVSPRQALAWHDDSREGDRPATSGSAPVASAPAAPVWPASACRCDEPHSAITSDARAGRAR